MIIEIMLIILAMISVVVNTIVSVIIIKDTLNNRKWQDRIDKEININAQHSIPKEQFNNCLNRLAEVKDQLKQNNQQAEANGVKIAMNSLYGKLEQKENEQNDKI